ncbi:MAG TPA: esterase-like activity of phytase family protein [Hanamia sp.]
MDFDKTTIGGLSGIDFDPQKKLYYMISDDRSDKNPARFYTARILISKKNG